MVLMMEPMGWVSASVIDIANRICSRCATTIETSTMLTADQERAPASPVAPITRNQNDTPMLNNVNLRRMGMFMNMRKSKARRAKCLRATGFNESWVH